MSTSRRSRLALALAATGLALAIAGALLAWGQRPAASAPARTGAIDDGVVDVYTNLAYAGAAGAGTGIVITPSGEVLTNNHVVRGGTTIRVVDVATGRRYGATVLGYDLVDDVALVRLKGARGLTVAPLGDSSTVHTGDSVTAVGNAGGAGGSPSVVHGTVTALHRALTVSDDQGGSERLSDLIRIDAPLVPGDSGGPLLNSAQQVIGIDTAASTGFQFRAGGAVGFAIPIKRALAIARQIEAGRSSTNVHVGPTAFLGVSVARNGSTRGALVAAVVPGAPAARAGVVAGDVIVTLNGHTVSSATALTSLMLHVKPGKPALLRWLDQLGAAHGATVRPAVGPPQ